MNALTHMALDIRDWVSQNAFGVSGYTAFSFVFGKVPIHSMDPKHLDYISAFIMSFFSTIANVNICLAFGVGILTLAVKGVEFYEKVVKARGLKKKASAKPEVEDEVN